MSSTSPSFSLLKAALTTNQEKLWNGECNPLFSLYAEAIDLCTEASSLNIQVDQRDLSGWINGQLGGSSEVALERIIEWLKKLIEASKKKGRKNES